ncbi:flagellar motor protein MotB [Legionella israelensis]|uniref:flagellar motor protein MotB n=1 Tax=Legionella israelensis TaxID=454 RepID=UPI00117C2D44|nr:flagellar motor protein MotB [Legionella israelensis]QDP73471.1 flagellar motor protein MotB [Legionella israelensis]
MEDNKNKPVIIVKKIIKKKPAHHGGSWKIAYADFVTAMMAFFLLMWLLSMLNKFELMGIANYFKKPNKHVFVDNKKNDTQVKKIPAEQTKKYKLVMTHKEETPVDAKSRGSGLEKTNQKKEKSNNKKDYLESAEIKQIEKARQPKEALQQSETDKAELLQLQKRLENALEHNKELKKYKGMLSFEMMESGLKIDLRDLQNKPMFSLGKTDFEAHANHILRWLSAELNQGKRKVMIIGHTDAQPYPDPGSYSNWELSADRANATRRALIKYGMSPDKIVRIQGAGNTKPINKYFKASPMNRRIEIILLTEKALKKLLKKD